MIYLWKFTYIDRQKVLCLLDVSESLVEFSRLIDSRLELKRESEGLRRPKAKRKASRARKAEQQSLKKAIRLKVSLTKIVNSGNCVIQLKKKNKNKKRPKNKQTKETKKKKK